MVRVPPGDRWVDVKYDADTEFFDEDKIQEPLYRAFEYANEEYGYTVFKFDARAGVIYGIEEEEVKPEPPKRTTFSLYGER